MDDLELRKWAMEQVVLLHRGSGLTTEELIRQASALIAFVKAKDTA